MTNTELVSRLLQLESRISRLRMTLIVVVSLVFVTFVASGAAQQKSDTVRATKFELVDSSGNVLATWASEQIGLEDSKIHPTLRFNTERGRIIVGKSIDLSDNGAKAGLFLNPSGITATEENAAELWVSTEPRRVYETCLNLKGQLKQKVGLHIGLDPKIYLSLFDSATGLETEMNVPYVLEKKE